MRQRLYFVGRGKWHREWWVMADDGKKIVVHFFQFEIAADNFRAELLPWV